jgi:imidazolonepropionase-like amidohydrolase
MRKVCVILIFLFFSSVNKSFLFAQVRAIQFGKIVDGQGRVITNALIIVNADRIVRVGTEKDISIPPGAEIINLKSYTAIPGLIDAHTHITFYWDKAPGSNPWTQFGTLGPAVTVFLARQNALKALETGVTTVRDLGSNDYMDISMRDLINRGEMVGPRMFVAGNGLHISNTPYSTTAHADAGLADGIGEVQRVARQNIAAGADWIKIYASTGSDKDVTGFQTYTYEEMKAAADVAHMAGKRIALHSYGPEAVNDAIRAGVNTIEHATDVDDSTFSKMARAGITYVPTIDHNRYYVAHKDEYGYDSSVVAGLNKYIDRNFETLKKAMKAKVKIAMGSDAVFTGFGENTYELGWFVKAGMTPAEALKTATINGAEMLGMEKDLGVIAAGYFADIVAVEGDPLKDINVVIHNVKWVMKGGKVVMDKTKSISINVR